MMSKQNLNPLSWHISLTQNRQTQIKNEKVKAPKGERVKNSEKQNIENYKVGSQKPRKYLYVAPLLLKFLDDL